MGYWMKLLAGVAVVLRSMISTCGAVDWRQPCSGSSPADRVSRGTSHLTQTAIDLMEKQDLQKTLEAIDELTSQLNIVKRNYIDARRYNGRNDGRTCTHDPDISFATGWQRLYRHLAQTVVYVEYTLSADRLMYETDANVHLEDEDRVVHHNLGILTLRIRKALCALYRLGVPHSSIPTRIRSLRVPDGEGDRYVRDSSVITHLLNTLTDCGRPWVQERLCTVQKQLDIFRSASDPSIGCRDP